jgi:hypothetical protein
MTRKETRRGSSDVTHGCGVRRRVGRCSVARRDDSPLVDPINIAHIRVTGIAGLGFVLLALAVAAYIPSIGVSLATGAVLGIVFAVVLILRRRRIGPLPSSGRRPGANTTLSIEMGEPASDNQTKDSVNLSRTTLVTAYAEQSL